MVTAAAGNFVRAEDIVDTVEADIVEDTSVGSVPANFSITEAVVRTALGGRLVFVHLLINTTNALTSTGGNITDTTIFTLDAAYRPSENVSVVLGNGSVAGEGIITTAGLVQVRAASHTIAAGTNIRVSATFITAA